MDNKVYHPDIDELSDDKCTKVPILPSAYPPAYAEWLEQLESSNLAYALADAEYCLCQLPVCSIHTIVHKSKFIAEKFCSIPVEGSTLCKHHKQLYPSKCILCGILTWHQVVQSPTEVIQYDNKKLKHM